MLLLMLRKLGYFENTPHLEPSDKILAFDFWACLRDRSFSGLKFLEGDRLSEDAESYAERSIGFEDIVVGLCALDGITNLDSDRYRNMEPSKKLFVVTKKDASRARKYFNQLRMNQIMFRKDTKQLKRKHKRSHSEFNPSLNQMTQRLA